MCHGDSGGPVVQSGTNVVLALTSYGPAANCAAVGYAQRLDTPEVLGFIAQYS
jgi:secreted trypsin-like serine protease